MREGDTTNPEPDTAIKRRNRLALVRGGRKCHQLDENACMVRQHDETIRVSERCSYLSAHYQARKNADTGAASRSCKFRRLHPLVPPRPPGHLERVHLC